MFSLIRLTAVEIHCKVRNRALLLTAINNASFKKYEMWHFVPKLKKKLFISYARVLLSIKHAGVMDFLSCSQRLRVLTEAFASKLFK
jgi:hypothetical protein